MNININDLLIKSILDNKHLNVIKFLIENGANINIKINNENVLIIVCKTNIKNINLIDYILETEIKSIDFKHLIFCLNRKLEIKDKDILNKIQKRLNLIINNEYIQSLSIGC